MRNVPAVRSGVLFNETFMKLMKLHHLLPEGSSVTTSFYVKAFVFNFAAFPIIFGAIAHIVFQVRVGATDMSLYVNISEILAMICYLTVISHTVLTVENLLTLNTHISNYIDEQEEPPGMDQFNLESDKTLTYCYVFVTILGILYGLGRFMFVDFCELENQRHNMDTVCGLVFSSRYPFDFHDYPVKQFIQAIQFFETLYMENATTVVIFGLYKFIRILIIRYEYLISLLDHIISQDGNINFKLLFKWIVYHNNILSMVNKLNDFIWLPTLVFFVLINTLIGFIGVETMMNPTIQTFVFLFGWSFLLSLLHRNGQNLIDTAEKLSEKIYDVGWYNIHPRYRFIFKTILIRSQRPVRIIFGPFSAFSLESLMMAMKTSYSLMAFVNNSHRKNL